MRKRKLWWFLLPLFLVILLITACAHNNTNSVQSRKNRITRQVKNSRHKKKAKNSSINQKMVPTFFFHGYGSSVNAETHMVNTAVNHGVTRSVLTEIVHPNASVTLTGTVAKGDNHPIIKVGLEDNTNGDRDTDARYAYNAVKTLQKRYHFNKMNLVGHSMGNMDIMFMLLEYGQRRDFPMLNREVAIAGPFNGVRGLDDTSYAHVNSAGKPSTISDDYERLLKLRQTYPHASVMNIYGNLKDGTQSDQDVTIYAAKSLKYLVSPRARHYEEHEIKGPNAEHSKLHDNQQVDNLLIGFLWNK